MPDDKIKDKVQEVVLRFADGTVGRFIGPAIFTEKEMKEATFSTKHPIAISPPRDLTDEIREELIQKST